MTTLAAIAVMTVLGAVASSLLLMAARRVPADEEPAVDSIEACLPRIQCGQCGYPGCRPYARAILRGDAAINQCPPGGQATIDALARVMQAASVHPDPGFGQLDPTQVAWIDESACVGCARCLDACPVDAIIGAHPYTHTVLTDECTGCALCLPACPVDCIQIRDPNPEIHRYE